MSAYSFNVDYDNNLITVVYDECIDYDGRIDVLDELVNTLVQQPTLNILIDVRLAQECLSPAEQIQYAEEIGTKSKYFQSIRTAILAKKEANPHPLIVPVTFLKGVRKIAEFHHKNEALDWLNGEIA